MCQTISLMWPHEPKGGPIRAIAMLRALGLMHPDAPHRYDLRTAKMMLDFLMLEREPIAFRVCPEAPFLVNDGLSTVFDVVERQGWPAEELEAMIGITQFESFLGLHAQ